MTLIIMIKADTSTNSVQEKIIFKHKKSVLTAFRLNDLNLLQTLKTN